MTLEDIEDLEEPCAACIDGRIQDPDDYGRKVVCGFCRGVGRRLTAEGDALIEFFTRHLVLDARDVARGLREAEHFGLKSKSSL